MSARRASHLRDRHPRQGSSSRPGRWGDVSPIPTLENRPTVTTDPLNHPATTTYDLAESQTTAVSDQASAITTNTYSVRGFLATQTDPQNNLTTYTYSATGKVLTVTYPKQYPSGGTGTAVYTYTYD